MTEEHKKEHNRITQDPAIMVGKPVVGGVGADNPQSACSHRNRTTVCSE